MPDADVSAAEMVLREELAGQAKNSLAPSYSLPGRFRTRRRVRWNGIFPANDASIFPRSKTGVLFPLISPNTTWFILWEICHPKGSIEVFF